MGEVKLSEAELAELKDIFRMFDKDNSGSIDVNELESMVSSLGKCILLSFSFLDNFSISSSSSIRLCKISKGSGR